MLEVSLCQPLEVCVQWKSIADVALPSVLPGCCVRDLVAAEALPGLLGSSGWAAARGGWEVSLPPVPAVSAVGVAPLRVQARSAYFVALCRPRSGLTAPEWQATWPAGQLPPLRW